MGQSFSRNADHEQQPARLRLLTALRHSILGLVTNARAEPSGTAPTRTQNEEPTPMVQSSPLPPPAPQESTPQFPLPGTFVVVQGVFHTTDVSSPPATSNGSNGTADGMTSNPGFHNNAEVPPTISTGTIDVLGTLLTVTAHATAASLLASASTSLAPALLPASALRSPNASPSLNSPRSSRDRLGAVLAPAEFFENHLRNANPAVSGNLNQTSHDDRAPRLLDEMVRSFNVELGLAQFGGISGAGAAAQGTAASLSTSPRSISRAVQNTGVTVEEGTENDGNVQEPEAASDSFERFLLDLQVELRMMLGGVANAGLRRTTAVWQGEAEGDWDGSLDEPRRDEGGREPEMETRENSNAAFDSALDNSRTRNSPLSLASQPLPPPSSSSSPSSPLSPPHPVRPGAVNWWRLYRFPQHETVVPAIVVGLQSMHHGPSGMRMERGREVDGTTDGPGGLQWEEERERRRQGISVAASQHGIDDDASGRWNQGAGASAAPNFGRDRGSEQLGGFESERMSRTFLIHVIGGYYPPAHGIFTVGIDSDFFETLMELGNIPPSTASKADIAGAGLEFLKYSVLAEYVAAGRITEDCAERCVICLDDYDEEGDIRLLTCRHAFHRNCIDRWLCTGCNNCPACRTTGVANTTAR